MEYEYCHTRCKSAFTVFPKENGISSEEISERFLILAESEESQFFSEESSEKFFTSPVPGCELSVSAADMFR